MPLALGAYARAAAKAAAEPKLLAAESVPQHELEEGVLEDTRYTFADGTRRTTALSRHAKPLPTNAAICFG